MDILIDKLNISYDEYGKGKELIFLHGWGSNKESFNPVIDNFKNDYKIYNIDLPGFGHSSLNEALSITDMALILHKFFLIKKIENPIIIAHSYGGRVAIRYTHMFGCDKLILIASAGIKHKKKFKIICKEYIYKTLKKIHIKVNMGSDDYKNANSTLKKMMVMALNDDQKEELNDIKSPTLLVWGDSDKIIPKEDMIIMNENIENSGIVIMPNCGHFPHLDDIRYFNIVLNAFLKSDN